MEKSKAIFGSAESIVEQTKNPRLIAKRVGEIEVANKNKRNALTLETKAILKHMRL